MTILKFRRTVMRHYVAHGRTHLPWRRTRDPYQILVSEIMLQQTQVDRVIPYFERWVQVFPTVQKLARVPLSAALKEWSGLGYNRRAKLLHACAREIVQKHSGKIPKDFAALVSLPAIGPYTAGAIRAFAFNEPGVFIETNIRTALIHHFFPNTINISDRMLLSYAEKAALRQEPRTWYAALMDYGAHIKKTHPNPSRHSKHHTKQPRFEGSLRQVRGALIRALINGPITETALLKIDEARASRIKQALKSLERDGMLMKKRKKWCLAA